MHITTKKITSNGNSNKNNFNSPSSLKEHAPEKSNKEVENLNSNTKSQPVVNTIVSSGKHNIVEDLGKIKSNATLLYMAQGPEQVQNMNHN